MSRHLRGLPVARDGAGVRLLDLRVLGYRRDELRDGGVTVHVTPATRIVSASGAPRTAIASGETVAAIGTSGADGVLATRVVVLSEATAVATETGREATVTALAVAPNPLAGIGRLRYDLATAGTTSRARRRW